MMRWTCLLCRSDLSLRGRTMRHEVPQYQGRHQPVPIKARRTEG